MGSAVVEADPRAVGEGLPAEAADERALSSVGACVDLQRARLGESLAALRAAVWSLPSMSSLVGTHPGQVWETSATEVTVIGLLPGVDPPVDLQGS